MTIPSYPKAIKEQIEEKLKSFDLSPFKVYVTSKLYEDYLSTLGIMPVSWEESTLILGEFPRAEQRAIMDKIDAENKHFFLYSGCDVWFYDIDDRKEAEKKKKVEEFFKGGGWLPYSDSLEVSDQR